MRLETSERRKPTRRDLLIVLGRCQRLFGGIGSCHEHRNSAARLQAIQQTGLDLCTDALGHDEPILRPTGPWKDDLSDGNWRQAV